MVRSLQIQMNIIPQQKIYHYEYSSSGKNYHSTRKNECLHMPTVLTNETEKKPDCSAKNISMIHGFFLTYKLRQHENPP
jgi:hypothetical protein